MTGSAEFLPRLLKHPMPGFICANSGADNTQRYLARVRHLAQGPAAESKLSYLRELLRKKSGSLERIYVSHDGLLLFGHTISRFRADELSPGIQAEASGDGGFRFLPIDEWELAKDKWATFARIPFSDNSVRVCTRWWHRGWLREQRHDAPPEWRNKFFSLELLLHRICTDPARFLYRSGCYTRYADGETSTQWIPIRYVPDARLLSEDPVMREPLPKWFH